VSGAENTETALDDIVRLTRSVLIFDSIVLYLSNDGESLEPSYARAIGRGRFREADLVWGEITAQDTFNSHKTTTRIEEVEGESEDRMNIRHILGLPVKLGEQMMGALVLIRFGGPVFEADQIHLAEFIAVHIAQLVKHRQLVDQVATLEAERRLDRLQDDFVATISHELLTPLGFIKGYATTLLREDTTWDDKTMREFLTIIDEESDRLRELIDSLLDSSRLQAGTLRMSFQPIRLDTMLREISLRARSRHDSMVIKLEIKTPGVQISADPTRLAQVFDNIINNAEKYAPGSPIKITLDTYNGKARIALQDNGPGIQPEQLEKIFQRFYRVPEISASTRGTGLGLYICRKIIQGHNGEIEAESVPGKGTTFFIYLPYMEKGR
jgi:signal transduction histidine kinase